MIVTDDDMHAVVQYLAAPEVPADADLALTMAEIGADKLWSELYKTATGTIGDREAFATSHDDYWKARVACAKAQREVKYHQGMSKKCDLFTKIWEREKFSAWSAERVR